MGTFVAQELALGYPEKVDKLILYAGAPGGKEALPPSPAVIAVLTNTTGTDRERGERLFGILFPPVWLTGNPDPSKYFPRVTEMSPPGNVQRQDAAIEAWNGTWFPVACPAAAAPADSRRTGCHCPGGKLVTHRRTGPPLMGCKDPGWRTRADVPVPGQVCRYYSHLPCTRDLISPVHSVFSGNPDPLQPPFPKSTPRSRNRPPGWDPPTPSLIENSWRNCMKRGSGKTAPT